MRGAYIFSTVKALVRISVASYSCLVSYLCTARSLERLACTCGLHGYICHSLCYPWQCGLSPHRITHTNFHAVKSSVFLAFILLNVFIGLSTTVGNTLLPISSIVFCNPFSQGLHSIHLDKLLLPPSTKVDCCGLGRVA